MYRLYTILIAIGLAVANVYADKPSEELNVSYYDLVGRADKAIEEGRWGAAEEYLLTAISNEPQHPTNVLLMSNLGLVQYNMGHDSLAVETLTKAHAIAPRSVTILYNRAQVLEAIGNDSLAIVDYSGVIKLDSTLVDPVYARTMLLIRHNHLPQALADCERLAAMASDDTLKHRAYATYYTAAQQWVDAVPHFTALLQAHPSADDYCGRAVCYLMLNRLNEASADISSGLELEPDNRSLFFYRAHLNKARYRKEDARADMRRALEPSSSSQNPQSSGEE
ncbi:MAG: hypothetical protein NC343_02675 [Muribaculum sp.]|nr:hypothetical protein [Muribaculaceae bacterium]MCM1080631.1 hypothetical protein [Muribaculum sp.]